MAVQVGVVLGAMAQVGFNGNIGEGGKGEGHILTKCGSTFAAGH